MGRHLPADQFASVFEGYVLSHTYNDIALNPADDLAWLDTFWALLNPQQAA